MSPGAAPDDVVSTWADAAGNARPPLLVVGPLTRFLDARGIGAGPIACAPIGDGHSNVTYAVRGLRQSPGFTIAVAVTLGLGLGVNAAMFTLIDQFGRGAQNRIARGVRIDETGIDV